MKMLKEAGKAVLAAVGLGLMLLATLQLGLLPALAISGGTNITCVGGSCSVTGPFSTTSLTANSVVLGNGSNGVTASNAGTGTNEVLRSGTPPAFGALTDADIPDTITIDNAATADALSANGANCSAGNYPLGVDEAGAAEGCTAVPAAVNPVITIASETVLAAGVQTYYLPLGGSRISTTEADVVMPLPAGTYENLRCLASAIPGAGNDVVATVRTGAIGSLGDSSLTVTLNSAAYGEDTTNNATTTAGQGGSLSIAMPASLSNGSVYVTCSVEKTA